MGLRVIIKYDYIIEGCAATFISVIIDILLGNIKSISLGKGFSGQQDEEEHPPRFSFSVSILSITVVSTSSQSPTRRYTVLLIRARAYSSGIITLCPDLQLVMCLPDGLCEKHVSQRY